MKVVRLSALRNGRLYPQELFLVLISARGWVDNQGHSAAGRIMSMKNSNDTIGNRTRNLPVCSAVPQPTAPLRAPDSVVCFFMSVEPDCNTDFRFPLVAQCLSWWLIGKGIKIYGFAVHVIKTYTGNRGTFHSLFTLAVDGAEWSTWRPGRFTHGKEAMCPLNLGPNWPQSVCGYFGEEMSFWYCPDLNLVLSSP
jgi:hypothetical protein